MTQTGSNSSRIEGRLDFTDTSSVAAQGLGLFGVKLSAIWEADL